MSNSYVIVWDLDNTLGEFEQLNCRGDSAEAISVRLRPQLRGALESLQQAGFQHTLLTLSTPIYAEIVLRGCGLRDFFAQVEGYGQRGKGDAAGIATDLGISEADRPHRMLFVGDHPINDEPRDPRVVFHLECFALTRSAMDLARLTLYLRERGEGSLRTGFNRVGQPHHWLARLLPWRNSPPLNRPVECDLPDLDSVLLLQRDNGAPVIGFAQPPEPAREADVVSFVPGDYVREARASAHRTSVRPPLTRKAEPGE